MNQNYCAILNGIINSIQVSFHFRFKEEYQCSLGHAVGENILITI